MVCESIVIMFSLPQRIELKQILAGINCSSSLGPCADYYLERFHRLESAKIYEEMSISVFQEAGVLNRASWESLAVRY